MDIRPIRTPADHEAALREIDRLWGAPPGTSAGDKLDVLTTLVEKYEEQFFPPTKMDPVEFLEYAFTDMGHSQKELAELIGSRSRASEIMARKRPLTLDQIRRISAAWNVPIEILAQPYLLADEIERRRHGEAA